MLKTVNFNFKRFYLKIAIPIFFFGAIINAETILSEDFESFVIGSLNGQNQPRITRISHERLTKDTRLFTMIRILAMFQI